VKISGNAARVSGGGIFNDGGGTVTLQLAKVKGNVAPLNADADGAFTFI
jgi:hypothetical protein